MDFDGFLPKNLQKKKHKKHKNLPNKVPIFAINVHPCRMLTLWHGAVPGAIVRVIVVCLSEIYQTGGGLMTIDMPSSARNIPSRRSVLPSSVVIDIKAQLQTPTTSLSIVDRGHTRAE